MIPPLDSTGSAMNAARLPVHCRSSNSNASSSSSRQLTPANRGRYAFGAGMAKLPGIIGPIPRRPAL